MMKKEDVTMKYIPEEKLKGICEELDCRYGFYVSLPDEGERFELFSDTVINSASTIKIPLLALLMKDFEEGRLDPDQPLPLEEENRAAGSGILKTMSHKLALSLYDYAVLMTVISDNSATNRIIESLGVERVNQFLAENGWKDTHLAGKLFQPKPILPDGTEDYNRTSARDLGDMMEKILKGELVSEKASKTMFQIMLSHQLGKFDKTLPMQRHTDPALPMEKLAEGSVYVACKGGTLTGKVLHDAAIILFSNGKRAVITLMTEATDKEKAMQIFGRLSKTLYDSLT